MILRLASTNYINCMHRAMSVKSDKMMYYVESGTLWVIHISVINWLLSRYVIDNFVGTLSEGTHYVVSQSPFHIIA